MYAAEWGTGQVFWSMMWFFLFTMWIFLLVSIYSDIFRSADLSGWGKALWSIFILVVPFLGVLVYLIARGGKMTEHAMEEARVRDAVYRGDYGQYAPPPAATSDVDQLVQLATLRKEGVIDEAEFLRLKSKVTMNQKISA
jgi:hypothetical protein